MVIDLDSIHFSLKACRACGFMFKDPIIPEERLLDCYRRSSGTNWGIGADPRARRFDLIEHLVNQKTSAGRHILDIGCSNGDLLDYLSRDWTPFGIEPSADAARMAQSRGITILGATLDALAHQPQRFDAITAVDVAEHIAEPVPFFRQVADLLEPGGVFVVVTGDSDAWTWRLLGSLYWYCIIPEHVSFYSRSSMRSLAQRAGLELVDYHRTSHQRQTLGRTFIEWFKNASYLVGRPLKGLGIPPLRRLFVERGSPGWLSAKDHLFCALRKPH